MLDHSTQTGQHPHIERGADLYETPPVAVEALMNVERLPKVIWEPACGPGSIVRVLRTNAHLVYATDINDYGCEDATGGVDFLRARAPSFSIDAVITNPPFKFADRFVAHALALSIPKVIMLLRLAFLESARRSPVLDSGLLARVHVFRNRLPMMHRHGWTGPKASSAMPFAWFVWDLAHRGSTELHRVSW